MGLRFDPIGGGQFKQAVKAMVDAESQPIRQMEVRKQRDEAKLKLFQEFKNKFQGIDKAITELGSFQKFRELKVDLGEGANSVSVTIDREKAQPGSYELEIDQLAARSSMISNGFDSCEEPILGMGFITMQLANGESAEIYVDDSDSSLRGVANLINKEADSPVRAAVIKDAGDPETPWRLIISAKKDGADNAINFPDFYFLDGAQDFYVDDNRDAENARIQVDGFSLEADSNDITDFLPGINIHLKQAKPDQPFMMMITQDYQKIAGKMKFLVEEVNKVLDFIVKQNQIDEKSDTRTTFAGDTTLQSIEYRIRNLMHEGYPTGDPESDDFKLVFLNQLGVEFQKDGTLQFKEEKFQKTLEKDFDGISQAISGEIGFAQQMRGALDAFTRGTTGILATRETGLRARIKEMDHQIETKQAQVDRKQQALTEQFARLEGSLSTMQRQSQYLSATMPGAGGGGNLVSQLLGG
ncbi:flagellar filament capping protein FliD [Bdellovibrionota bacterium FG-1]